MECSVGRRGYSIAAVSKLTGISCHALRVWERRYRYPTPCRSPSGHRRYNAEDVVKIREIIRRIDQGQHVGAAIAATVATGAPAAASPASHPPVPCEPSAWLGHLRDGEIGEADKLFRQASQDLDPIRIVTELIEPALVEVGECWFRGEWGISSERCATEFLRRKLNQLIDEAQMRNQRPRGRILVGTVQGDRHEGGVLIVTLLMELAGWRAVGLGVDVPVSEYARAVAEWRPEGLALSFVLSRNIRKRFQELSRLKDVPVFVGGRSILNYRGLARSFGLIPVVGPAPSAVEQVLARFDAP